MAWAEILRFRRALASDFSGTSSPPVRDRGRTCSGSLESSHLRSFGLTLTVAVPLLPHSCLPSDAGPSTFPFWDPVAAPCRVSCHFSGERPVESRN